MTYVFVDVREPAEFNQGHVAGAINLPPGRLMDGSEVLAGVPKDAKLVVYCRTGSRSNVAMHILRQRGFQDIVNGINPAQVKARFGVS